MLKLERDKSHIKEDLLCAICDQAVIKRAYSNTGDFYCVAGHRNGATERKEELFGSGGYEAITFAVCCRCKPTVRELFS